MEDALGWNPITYAAADGTGYADCERFGDLGTGAAVFTVYNTGEKKKDFDGALQIDLNAMKVPDDRAARLIVFDLLNNAVVPAALEDGTLSCTLTLVQKDLFAVLVGTEEEVWAMLFERVRSAIGRGEDAAAEIPAALRVLKDDLPSHWDEIMTHMDALRSFADMDAAAARKKAGTLAAEMGTVMTLAEAALHEMYDGRQKMKIDVLNPFTDASAILNGLGWTDVPDASGDSGAGKWIACAAAAAVLAAGGGAAIRLAAKKKKR
jgi:hypothetical protein